MGFDFLSQADKIPAGTKRIQTLADRISVFGPGGRIRYGYRTEDVRPGNDASGKVLDCRYEVHEHTEDCYEEDENGEKILICGLADYVIHVHNDDCYDQKGNLVCQLEEHELHEHDDSCWEEEEVLICGEGGVGRQRGGG